MWLSESVTDCSMPLLSAKLNAVVSPSGFSAGLGQFVLEAATTRTVSNAAGNYSAPFLVPGTYRVTVKKTGFKTVVRTDVVLNLNDRLEINVPLDVGTTSDTITVLP